MSFESKLTIQELIARFANCLDVKDWSGLESCLTESVYVDYSDLRGVQPGTMRANEYVFARRESLEDLQLHHLIGNYEIGFPNAVQAVCRASMVIWRRAQNEEFASHCMYEFELVKQDNDWKISGITQKILWNSGNAFIHKGVADQDVS